jgi:hypothetical protein
MKFRLVFLGLVCLSVRESSAIITLPRYSDGSGGRGGAQKGLGENQEYRQSGYESGYGGGSMIQVPSHTFGSPASWRHGMYAAGRHSWDLA